MRNFHGTFSSTTSLKSVPDDFFSYATGGPVDLEDCFHYSGLTNIPSGLQYATNVVTCDYMFQNCTSISGSAIPFWTAETYPALTGHVGAYRNCTNLSNYADIPGDFK